VLGAQTFDNELAVGTRGRDPSPQAVDAWDADQPRTVGRSLNNRVVFVVPSRLICRPPFMTCQMCAVMAIRTVWPTSSTRHHTGV
jgi:hypothetical protein